MKKILLFTAAALLFAAKAMAQQAENLQEHSKYLKSATKAPRASLLTHYLNTKPKTMRRKWHKSVPKHSPTTRKA